MEYEWHTMDIFPDPGRLVVFWNDKNSILGQVTRVHSKNDPPAWWPDRFTHWAYFYGPGEKNET